MRMALQDQRQRARPERVDQCPRIGRNVGGPVAGIAAGRQMHDHRMVRRTPFAA
jgi:hypothetical protein